MKPFSVGRSIILEDVRYILDISGYCLYHSQTHKNTEKRVLIKTSICYDYTAEYKENLKKTGRNIIKEYLLPPKRIKNYKIENGIKEYISSKTVYPVRLTLSFITKDITENCDAMGEDGFCDGHSMSRQKFINKYCNGIVPPQAAGLGDIETI